VARRLHCAHPERDRFTDERAAESRV